MLAGNYLTTGRAAIGTTHISAFGLFQFDFEMLTEWTVRVLAPLPCNLAASAFVMRPFHVPSTMCANRSKSNRPTWAPGG